MSVLSSDIKKMSASIGRESEKSSKDDYEGVHDEVTREGLLFPLKRKSEKWKCHDCPLKQSSRGEKANIKEKNHLKSNLRPKHLNYCK